MASKNRKLSTSGKRPRNISLDSRNTKSRPRNISLDSQNTKSRAKNYSSHECDALVECSERFRGIIDKNSNNERDKEEKERAWITIKEDFDEYCAAQGFYVSKECKCCFIKFDSYWKKNN